MSVFMEELIIYILYLSSNITSMFLLCNATMKRRHAPTVWIVYCIIKTIIVNIVFRIFCDELIRTNEWMRCIYLTLVSVFAILTYIMMLYTFEEELSKIASKLNIEWKDMAMAVAIYMLGFSSYKGFSELFPPENEVGDDAQLKRIYEYAKRMTNL